MVGDHQENGREQVKDRGVQGAEYSPPYKLQLGGTPDSGRKGINIQQHVSFRGIDPVSFSFTCSGY